MNPSLKSNVIANGLGQGWRALMALAFVPLYIRYLGIESYGLMGLFAVLQTWLSLLDMGMKPTLGREMARFTGGGHDSQSIRNLLRSIEFVGIAVALAITLGAWVASGWLATHWLKATTIPAAVVAKAFSIMGGVAALRFLEDIYVSALAGLQRQVTQNIVTSAVSTARGLGAAGVLAWISPTLTAFFIWQGLISLVSVIALAGVVHGVLPQAPVPARFSAPALAQIWRFAAGMMAITGLSLILGQIDKVLLSRLLPLESFGYYVLAGTVAGCLFPLTGAITAAFYPRFTALATRGDETGLRLAYHQGAQWVTVLPGSAAVVLMLFGGSAILLWTGNPVLARKVTPLTTVLVLGTLFNSLMWIPYQMMLSRGWTTLTIAYNVAAVCVTVPAILWVAPKYGAIGAAWIWVAVNAGSLLVTVPLMHRRLLRGEKWRWYRADVALPLVAAAAAAGICRALITSHLDRLGEFGALLASSTCTFLASAMAAPETRYQLARHVPNKFKVLVARPVTGAAPRVGLP